jgi:DNA-binding NtrC family response regulator
MPLVLLVEDEGLQAWALKKQLELQGYAVHEAPTLAVAEAHLARQRPDVVLLDINLPDGNGLEFLAERREMLSESTIIVMTAGGEVQDAVRAMKLGAADFLTKPVEPSELVRAMEKALDAQRDRLDAERSRRERERVAPENVVAESSTMKQILDYAATIAASPATIVLIEGATGTGKEVVARFIHAHSTRANGPRYVINCAALPSELVESELFGHERGAFTDAKATRRGAFELAQGGVLVFDEIGEMPYPLQAKLLRCLEERTIRRVGGAREIAVDVLVVAMTNRNLAERVEAGDFRRDLFYRLNVFPIRIPPLKDRREDVLPLAIHFLRYFGAAVGRTFEGFAPSVKEALLAHDWPGNVRELRNLMERVALLEPPGIVAGRSLALASLSTARTAGPDGPPAPAVAPVAPDPLAGILPIDEMELLLIQRAMRASRGNQSAAARLLGVSRDQLRYRIVRYRSEGRWSGGDEAVPES